MPKEMRAKLIESLSIEEIQYLLTDWSLWARKKQLPPEGGDWRVWLLIAGRGFGKTRAGAEWIRMLAENQLVRRIALVGETWHDVRSVMVEGASGLLSIAHPQKVPHWLPSRRMLVWNNGVRAFCYAADAPDQLRGPEWEAAWADEIAKWRYPLAFDNLLLGLRQGRNPRLVATTTPRPKTWLRDLAAAPDTILVQGTTHENAAHLAPQFLASIQMRLGSGDLARQELGGELLAQYKGALWQRDALASLVCTPPKRGELVRCLIGVDPSVGGQDETGIIVAGKTADGVIWVLEDASCAGTPDQWIRRLRRIAEKWRADAVVAEVNQGGQLIEQLLRQSGVRLPIRRARAMRGKAERAAPIAAAYARDEIRHADSFPELTDQLCAFSPDMPAGQSPDRMDALVWVIGALLTGLDSSTAELRL